MHCSEISYYNSSVILCVLFGSAWYTRTCIKFPSLNSVCKLWATIQFKLSVGGTFSFGELGCECLLFVYPQGICFMMFVGVRTPYICGLCYFVVLSSELTRKLFGFYSLWVISPYCLLHTCWYLTRLHVLCFQNRWLKRCDPVKRLYLPNRLVSQ